MRHVFTSGILAVMVEESVDGEVVVLLMEGFGGVMEASAGGLALSISIVTVTCSVGTVAQVGVDGARNISRDNVWEDLNEEENCN